MNPDIALIAIYAGVGVAFVIRLHSSLACTSNKQALLDSEDEIHSLQGLVEEEMRVAPKNVQPSSHAALQNAIRAVAELKARPAFMNRRRLAEKVSILGSHKTFYKAAQRKRLVTAASITSNLLKEICGDAADDGFPTLTPAESQKRMRFVELYSNTQVGKHTTTLSPADLTYLIDLDVEIQKLIREWWCDRTETDKKNLKKKKVEFALALENLEETQLLDWLLHLA